MKAILLAAGRSSRLYPLTLEKPKSLLDIGGKTLLECQLDALVDCNITEVVIVTGYLENVIKDKVEEVRAHYPFEFEFVHNPLFAEMNNIYSLWTARESVINSDFLCIYTDVLFHPGILHSLAKAEGDIVLVGDRDNLLEETMKMKLSQNRVTTVGRHVTMDEASATFLGIAKISADSSPLLFKEIGRLIEEGETAAFYTAAVEELIKQDYKVSASYTNQLPWIEVDLPKELSQAKEVFSLMAQTI